ATVYVYTHGSATARLGHDGIDIPIERVARALTNPTRGLPADFIGTVEISACHSGERHSENCRIVERLHRLLHDKGRLPKFVRRGIVAQITEQRVATKELLKQLKSTLDTTVGSKDATDICKEVQRMFTHELSVAEQLASYLSEKGRRAI